MPRPRTVQLQDLIDSLPAGEAVSAAALVDRLGITRTTLSRLVAEAGERIVRLGRTRATAYAVRKQTPAGSEWPLFRLRADATLEELGTVVALTGESVHVQTNAARPNLTRSPDDTVDGYFPGLPWYLDDLRPQGFLGRTFAHRRGRDLGVPEDLSRWQLGDTLQALVRAGGTEIGDLLLGGDVVQSALRALDAPPDHVLAAHRAHRYPERAAAALEGEDVGSSPGGEQPKFTATVEGERGRYAALVKFAQPTAGAAAERWADLLVCEHLALQCLRDAGVPAAVSELLQTETHTFLEVQRFDRSVDVLGRRGVVSLLALSSAFTGEATADWGTAAGLLHAQGWVDRDTLIRVGRLHAFGRLIGNSDMHQGNIGFHLTDRGPLPLAPAYDMLPMSLAPSRTGVLRAASPLATVGPDRSGQLTHLQWAAPLAVDYWQRVAGSSLLRSGALRELAAENVRRVQTMGQRFG
ncbi:MULTISPECIES: type II toxin-antitoxin system HipA family toxin YjjJ [unclassified Stenotrophomonas]|uniref:type II toxin-antitoxin system HipA family toxin YjjJ n=1 Tax=unclassified Stenotrophomonas TaxID=196198 RepID=UPI0021190B90|nr:MULTISPECIES: type II toxin-antitoxin system HipA family toxin YjjJ [unclassified Stenotrophomonas]